MGRHKGSKNGKYTLVKLICKNCNKIYYVMPCHKNQKYCSLDCSNQGKIGVPINIGINNPMYGNFREKNPHWKGGRIKHPLGYIWIKSNNHPFRDIRGYVLEHRLVIEKQIGRYLTLKEEIHHLGKVDNNKPNMLIAFSSKSAHRRFEGNPNNVKPEEIIFDGRLL